MSPVPTKRLRDLNPTFYGAGGGGVMRADGSPVPERSGLGLICDCPCGCGELLAVPFRNPIDGGPMETDASGRATWQRTGETFENLSLSPSILRVGGCGWHGFIENGQVRTV